MMQNLEQKLFNIIEGTINQLGFELVKITLQNQPKMFEILIDKYDNQKVSVGDCQLVSKNISILLDVQDVIKDKYYLVVSSAGLERPLITFKDYHKFLGSEIKMRLKSTISGCSHYRGKIIKAENNIVYLKSDDKEVEVPFDLIKSANLVLTDDMFRKLLNK
ncbi:Ribosome maturation factor RimP [Candidatus Trichorickettsia mobilis]|uniref:Ribosome maturation factor RimP n=2 Tax=Candidatus Trichorickettsia mobilis TaxID=1346319 RepID=A0ABZ0UST8_9RICK|nr:Ribosome maturation factor RimP [Candidatus Trichorickettsia mobilis]